MFSGTAAVAGGSCFITPGAADCVVSVLGAFCASATAAVPKHVTITAAASLTGRIQLSSYLQCCLVRVLLLLAREIAGAGHALPVVARVRSVAKGTLLAQSAAAKAHGRFAGEVPLLAVGVLE